MWPFSKKKCVGCKNIIGNSTEPAYVHVLTSEGMIQYMICEECAEMLDGEAVRIEDDEQSL